MSDKPTTAEIDELKRLDEAATPGPWSATCRDSAKRDDDYAYKGQHLGWEIEEVAQPDRGQFVCGHDAALIVYLRNNVAKFTAALADKEREGGELAEAVAKAWKRVAGFAVCESCGPENRYRITIDYPTLEKAQDAYGAMSEITAALSRIEQASE